VSVLGSILVAGLGLNLFVNAQVTAERGLIISPAIIELEGDRGGSYSLEVKVENDTRDQDMNISTVLQTFKASDDEGIPTVSDLEPESDKLQWVRFLDTDFQLRSGDKYTSNVVVSIPQDAQPGSYYFALTYANSQFPSSGSSSQVAIESRVSALLFLTVKGQIDRQVEFVEFSTPQSIYDPFFDAVTINYKIATQGNVYLKPSGDIFIGDLENPDTRLSLNPQQKIILPNSQRSFSYSSQKLIDKDLFNNRTPDFEVPIIGQKKITAVVLYPNNNGELEKKETEVTITLLPWKTILLGLLILGIIGLIVVYIKKSKSSKQLQ
jgi:hypothetical protein